MSEDPGQRVYIDRRRVRSDPEQQPDGFQLTWTKAGILFAVALTVGGFIGDVLRLEFRTGANADAVAVLTRRVETLETKSDAAHDSITRFELQIPALGKYITTTTNPRGPKP